jgi:hypothetical protein
MANSTSYELSLLLSLKDNASAGLDKFSAKLRSLDTQIAATYKGISNLQRVMGQPVQTAGLDSYLNKVKQLDKLSGTSLRIDNLLNKADRFNNPRTSYSDNYRGRHSERHGTLDRLERGRDMLTAPRDVADVWRRETDSLRPYVEATLDLTRAQEKFRALNLGEDANKTAFDAVTKNVMQLKGLSLAETTKQLTDLHTATGSLGHAIESLPVASKYHFAFSSLYGDKFSNEQIEEQIQNAFKYLEMTGKVSKGREEMERSLNTMTQIGTATGGRVNPAEMLLMARRGGASVRSLSDEGLRHLIAPMQELGGSGLGASMMSVYGTLVQGVMKQSAMAEFQKLGFLDKSKIEFNKSGIIKRVMPGGNALGDMFMDDPLQATDALVRAMNSKGITGEKDIRKELGVLFQNRTANKLVDTLITQRSLVTKDAQNSLQSEGYDALTKRAQDSPLGKIREFESALTDFKAKAGLPMIEVATKLGTALMPIGEFFGNHQNVATYGGELLLVSKGLSAVLESGVAINQSGLGSLLTRTGRSAASAGVDVENVGGKIGRLGGIVGGLTPLAVGLGLSAALALTLEIKSELDEIDKKNEELSQRVKGNYDSLIGGGKLYTKYLTPGDADSIASRKLTDLQKNGELQQSFNPWSKDNWWKSIIHRPDYGLIDPNDPNPQRPHFGGSQFNVSSASNVVQNLAPEFADMRVLKSFLVQARQGGLGVDRNQESQFEKAIEQAFPREYKAAAKEATDYLQELDRRTQDTSKNFLNISQATDPLPGELTNFRSALRSASAEVSGFHLEMPSVFGSNAPAPKSDTPGIRKPFSFGEPTAKPKSSLDGFFHKTSALRADVMSSPMPVPNTRMAHAVYRSSRQGKQFGDVHIHIDGNAPAAKDPHVLAASIREELSKLSQQVGDVTEEMRDDRLLERRMVWLYQRGRERA